MSIASEFWRSTIALVEDRIQKLSPFRAKATNLNNSGVQIQTYDSDTPLSERYARLRGTSVTAGDEVAVIPYGSSNLVLGSVAKPGERSAGSPSTAFINVKDFGAVGDNNHDDTNAIKAAINSLGETGGTVFFPAGYYKITSALPLRQHLTIQGEGDVVSEIKQHSTSAHGFSGVDIMWLNIENITIDGPSSGTGTGIRITRSTLDATNYIYMNRVTVQDFGQDGISISNCIVSRFNMVHSRRNGRHGWNIYGVAGGSAGTSCQFNVCYANENGEAGFLIDTMTYMQFAACVGEKNGMDWRLLRCYSMDFASCGTETSVYKNATYNGTSFYIYQCLGLTFHNPYVLLGRNIGYHITGGSEQITLIGAQEIDPQSGMVNSIKVDAGSTATILDYNVVKPLSLAPWSSTVLEPDGSFLFRNVLKFGSGNNLYEMGNGAFATDSHFTAWQGIATRSSVGPPTETQNNGTLVVDSLNSRLYVRVNGTWRYTTLT